MAQGDLTRLKLVRNVAIRPLGIQEFEGIIDVFSAPRSSPRAYFDHCWSRITARFPSGSGAIRGNLFELTIATTLALYDIVPFCKGVELSFVPNVKFDFIIWVNSPKAGYPVCISAKSSLRERYKQADLEATVLKNVHKRARTYLVTADPKLSEVKNLKNKIAAGDVLALDDCVYALDDDFNEFIVLLQGLKARHGIVKPPIVSMVERQDLFVSV